MRRKDREMTGEDALAALEGAKWGVLSTSADGIPYGVPVNYYYSREENAIFFHCAPTGRKLNNINATSAVSFTAVLSETIIPEKFATLYKSVIVSGRASLVDGRDEKIKRLGELCASLGQRDIRERDTFILKYLSSTAVVRIDIYDISGKSHR